MAHGQTGCWRSSREQHTDPKAEEEGEGETETALPPARPQLVLIKHSPARNEAFKYVSLCGPFLVKPPHVHSARPPEYSMLRAGETMTQWS